MRPLFYLDGDHFGIQTLGKPRPTIVDEKLNLAQDDIMLCFSIEFMTISRLFPISELGAHKTFGPISSHFMLTFRNNTEKVQRLFRKNKLQFWVHPSAGPDGETTDLLCTCCDLGNPGDTADRVLNFVLEFNKRYPFDERARRIIAAMSGDTHGHV